MKLPQRIGSLAGAFICAIALTACAPDASASTSIPPVTPSADASEPRAISREESELLAVSRWRNFDAGAREFTATLTDRGQELTLRGVVDFADASGIAEITGDFAAEVAAWTGTDVGLHPAPADFAPHAPVEPPADSADWRARALDTTASSVDTLLVALLNLGLDRPENPMLLRQSGSVLVRSDTIGKTPVGVYAFPPEGADAPPAPNDAATTAGFRLWVDESEWMLRAEFRIGAQWVTVDLGEPAGQTR